MAQDTIGIALIGTRFMGRAHSNAWRNAPSFFDLPLRPTRRVICGRDLSHAHAMAVDWEWEAATDDWREAIDDPAVGLVDVSTPNHVHRAPTEAALAAGKHVACEKPLAGTLEDARRMVAAAKKAKRRGVHTFVWFNYRRCPAVAQAYRFVRAGRLGRIYHVRATYLQDWGRPDTPASWRFDAKQAGSGAHGDLNAHIVDMARFLTGEEITEVSGAIETTFVKERRAVGPSGKPVRRTVKSTVDDCVAFLARFKGGAVGTFEATRLATGNQNKNAIEINGERGALRFDFERMNELEWWDDTLPGPERGWSRIMCTTPGDHPYVEHYWPPAHGLGYEHGFVSQAADIMLALGGAEPVVPLPDFEDAWRTQVVLETALAAARERTAVRTSVVARA